MEVRPSRRPGGGRCPHFAGGRIVKVMEPTTAGDPLASAPIMEIAIGLPGWVRDFVDWDGPYAGDDERMRLVVALARENVARLSGGPFAAAVFERRTGRLVSVGLNVVERLANSSAHAEVLALALAQRRVGSFTLAAPALPEHEIFSSCAPCAMCVGAVLWSGARRLVWGAMREDALAIGFDEGPVFPESIQYLRRRGIEVVPGLLRDDARAVLEMYAQQGGRIYNG